MVSELAQAKFLQHRWESKLPLEWQKGTATSNADANNQNSSVLETAVFVTNASNWVLCTLP
jgi:hypothetical protein